MITYVGISATFDKKNVGSVTFLSSHMYVQDKFYWGFTEALILHSGLGGDSDYPLEWLDITANFSIVDFSHICQVI